MKETLKEKYDRTKMWYDSARKLLEGRTIENVWWQECDEDYQKFLEKSKLLGARRKRLLEDYEKDEFNKLEEIYSQFQKNFDITRKQIEEEEPMARKESLFTKEWWKEIINEIIIVY